MYGYVYITTNLVNNKKYIGQHTSEKFDSKYHGSGVILLKAIKKYGVENFSTEILTRCDNRKELDKQEIYYIDKYNAVEDKNYYNTSFGGIGRNTLNCIKMYNKDLDKLITVPKCYSDFYKEKGYCVGSRPHSKESIENYKKAKKDVIPITDGQITKYIKKNELSDYEKQGWRKGRHKPTRPNQKKEKRKWMNKDGKSLMVKGVDIDKYLQEGYVFGRTHFDYHRDFDKNPVWNKGKKFIDGEWK